MAESIYKNENPPAEFVKIKHSGKVFTPDYLVNIILDQGHYVAGNINRKHVIDNSCGDGQFLVHVVNRYCKDFLEKSNDLGELKKELKTYIHGIEIEEKELNVCIKRCNDLIENYGIEPIEWDFICRDTLTVDKYNGKMDFVVGNPPYVRVHNLKENFDNVKSHFFCNSGMTDLYIVFYELSLKMLNETGIISYITPSSFFSSVAGANMRDYFVKNKLIESICDMKHFQAFNAMTYTAIVCLNKKHKSNNIKYYEFDSKKLTPYFIDSLSINDYYINNNFYFSEKENLKLLKDIICSCKEADIDVKNGFATLADPVFVNDFDFDSIYIIPVLKASRAKWGKIFYPYDRNGKFIEEEQIKKDTLMYDYLISNKTKLLKKDSEKNKEKYWYAYGRSQAINDTYKNKISINALIRTSDDLKIEEVPAGSGVYSGLYIISDRYSAEEIKNALKSKEFGVYISMLGKYKSGGYYTFSSKDVKYYMNYKLGNAGLLDNLFKE